MALWSQCGSGEICVLMGCSVEIGTSNEQKRFTALYWFVFAGLQPMWNLLIFLEASNLLNFTIDNTFSQWNWLTQFKSSWSVMNMADWCWLLPIFLSTMCHCYANVFMFIKGHQGSVAWRWNQGNWLVYCNLCVGIRSSQLSCWQLGLPCFRSGTCHRKPVRSDGLPRCHIA